MLIGCYTGAKRVRQRGRRMTRLYPGRSSHRPLLLIYGGEIDPEKVEGYLGPSFLISGQKAGSWQAVCCNRRQEHFPIRNPTTVRKFGDILALKKPRITVHFDPLAYLLKIRNFKSGLNVLFSIGVVEYSSRCLYRIAFHVFKQYR